MNATLLLAIATLALAVGPLLERFCRGLPALTALIDGATVGGIAVISALHLVPEAGAHIGGWAPILAGLGMLAPQWAEGLMARRLRGLGPTLGVLVLVLFAVHLLVEGAALASKAPDPRLGLATVLVVAGHRIPIGILLWGRARRLGRLAAIAILAAVGLLTWLGPQVVPLERSDFSAVCSALLAGGLLHLVLGHVHPEEEAASRPAVWSGTGFLAGAAGLFGLLTASSAHGGGSHEAAAPPTAGAAHAHGCEPGELAAEMLDLLLDVAPLLLLGLIGAIAIRALARGWPLRSRRWGAAPLQALRGAGWGTVRSVGSRGALADHRDADRRGAPPATSLALLVAVPLIGFESALLSWFLLGGAVTAARVVSAVLLAAAVGWLAGRLGSAGSGGRPSEDPLPNEPGIGRALALRRALFETWAHLSPRMLAGLLATVIVEPWIPTGIASELAPDLQVALLAVLGLPAQLCAAALTPFAAMLLFEGFAPGAVIALLLTGPAAGLATLCALSRLRSRPVASLYAALVLLGSIGVGLAANRLDLVIPGEDVARVHGRAGPTAWLSAAILLALSLWVVMREGPRVWLSRLAPGRRAGSDLDG